MEERRETSLIEHVRAVLNELPTKYKFGAEIIANTLEAKGVKFHLSGLMGGVVPMLIRNGEICKEVDPEGAIVYQRTPPPCPPKKRPAPDEAAVRNATKKRRKGTPHLRVSPAATVLLISERFLTAEEIAKRIKNDFDTTLTMASIYQTMRGYAAKKWVKTTKSDIAKYHLVSYRVTAEFMRTAMPIADRFKKRYPHLIDEINAAFEAFGRQSNAIKNEIQKQKKELQNRQDMNKPIDWELPENQISAADLGAAVIEYVGRLRRRAGEAIKGHTAEETIAKLKYKTDELSAQIFTRTNQVNSLERENKRLTKRLDSLIRENRSLKNENQNLGVALDEAKGSRPRSTFKMSEVASIKKLMEGQNEEVIDGITRTPALVQGG